jgi:hypothetical protein
LRKVLIATVVAGVLFTIGASAASFKLNAQDAASGLDEVKACITSSATVSYDYNYSNTDGYTIKNVKLDHPGCGGSQFDAKVRLMKSDSSLLAEVTLTHLSGNSTTSANLATTVKLTDLGRVAVLIDGAELSNDAFQP